MTTNVSRRDFAKIAGLGAAATALAGLGLASCSGGQGGGAAQSDTRIKVAASPTPHAQILTEAIAPLLKDKGFTLKVDEFNDYVQPNVAVQEGDEDANYFQHTPYLDNYNEENKTNIVSVVAVHYEPFGLYAGKRKSLAELADGDTVAVPSDATNEARALLLLQQEGLLKLRADAGVKATVRDIVENPKNLQFKELEAALVPRALQDVAIAAINANFAIEAGLSVSKDALARESASGTAATTYANIIAVNAGQENSEKTKALVAAATSPEVRDYINRTFDGAVLPIF
ncbi:metal ABC transporter substrate-binding protein [Eggerthellaceae bacterium zg-997]|nr:metal ABC transporter substrate-binding protein [Eggerthellaceae bacterium zg-997]